MIARDLRLRSAVDFDRVREQGQTWRNNQVVLIILPNERGRNRYGVAAGKRLGNAVRRNRMKRLLREALRALDPTLRQGYDIVLIARHGLRVDTPLADITSNLSRLLTRSGVLDPGGGSD
jgi:ribonuclease P protein component